MLYPSFSNYWNEKVSAKVIYDYQNLMGHLSDEDLAKIFDSAKQYNKDLYALKNPMTEYASIEGYNDIINIDTVGLMGFVTIDKINVEIPIYHGTSDTTLSKAAGHIEGTSLPIGGESTHAVISAHRGLPSAKLFRELDRMEVGDIFTITILTEVFTYQVDEINIVLPSDASKLQIVDGKDYVTLLTCTPYGINTHRMLVRGHRITTVENRTQYVTNEAYLVDRTIVMPIVSLPMIFVLIVYVIFKPVKKKVRVENPDGEVHLGEDEIIYVDVEEERTDGKEHQ